MQLEDIRMHDGSRLFAPLPKNEPRIVLRDHSANPEGATVTDFITDGVTEAWIDFEFVNYRFTVNNQFAEYCFSLITRRARMRRWTRWQSTARDF